MKFRTQRTMPYRWEVTIGAPARVMFSTESGKPIWVTAEIVSYEISEDRKQMTISYLVDTADIEAGGKEYEIPDAGTRFTDWWKNPNA